jgi:hypothetical protein
MKELLHNQQQDSYGAAHDLMMTTKNMIISLCVAVMASLISAEPGMQNGKMQRIPPHPDRGYVMPYRWVDSVCRREAEQGGWEGGFTACSTRYVRTIQANEAMCEEYSEKIRKWRPIVGRIPYDSALFEYFPEVHCRSFRGTGRKTKEYVDWIMKVDLSHVRNWYKLENMAETIEEVRYLYNARRIFEAMLDYPLPRAIPEWNSLQAPYLHEFLEESWDKIEFNDDLLWASYVFFSEWAHGTQDYARYLNRIKDFAPLHLTHRYYEYTVCRRSIPDTVLLQMLRDINDLRVEEKQEVYGRTTISDLSSEAARSIIDRWKQIVSLETGYHTDTLHARETASKRRTWLNQKPIKQFLRDYLSLGDGQRYLRGHLGKIVNYLGISVTPKGSEE